MCLTSRLTSALALGRSDMLWLVVLTLAVLALLYSAWVALKRSCWIITGGARNAPNPFSSAFLPGPGRLVTDHEERDKVIKQSFAPDKVPQSLDAIVIGEWSSLCLDVPFSC